MLFLYRKIFRHTCRAPQNETTRASIINRRWLHGPANPSPRHCYTNGVRILYYFIDSSAIYRRVYHMDTITIAMVNIMASVSYNSTMVLCNLYFSKIVSLYSRYSFVEIIRNVLLFTLINHHCAIRYFSK